LGKKEWKRAKECLSNINLFFQERNGGWLRYLKFRADWEMAMGKIQKEGMNELLESCRV
jgi:hypothetical protein